MIDPVWVITLPPYPQWWKKSRVHYHNKVAGKTKTIATTNSK